MTSRLKQTLFASAMVAFCGVGSAEESSVLDSATVLSAPMYFGSTDLQQLIGKSFKSVIISAATIQSPYSDDSKDFTIDFGSALAIRTVHLTNLQWGDENTSSLRMGMAEICLGSSTSPVSNTCPLSTFDSGFFDLANDVGQYLSIYRQGTTSVADGAAFNLQEVRVFQTPNIVNSSTVVITDYTGSNGTFPENLIQHLT